MNYTTVYQQKSTVWHKKLPKLTPFAGGMIFSSQISLLLNLYITEDRQNDRMAERQTDRQKKNES